MSDRIHNYLRAYRKRAGLSQEELAFLLGCEHLNRVSRYERSERVPGLAMAFGCELILNVQARDLFAELHRQVAVDIEPRVQLLLHEVSQPDPDPLMARKLQTLQMAARGGLSESAHEA